MAAIVSAALLVIRSPTPRSTASWASFFSSSSGRNRSTSMPATILAMAWSGIEGQRLLQKPKKSRYAA